MIDETTPRFFIIGVTKDNEQSVINQLEHTGFTNWWNLPEETSDTIYVSHTWGDRYLRLLGQITDNFNEPRITAEEYLDKEKTNDS